ncbi:MAG: 4Fe-4S dicluster domain-containing protein [Proteobacteria bacterium]|nr:4Fe-4S dicluster domain-containing protein [Pseudomonadota bacterium]
MLPNTSDGSVDGDHDSRREFLKHLLSGTATATVLMVFGPGVSKVSASHNQPRQGYNIQTEHEFAYVIDVNRCIGCGNCVRACARENAVPPGVFRTWVERYVVTNDGHVYVESPDGGREGFEEINAELRKAAKFSLTVPKMCNQCMDPPCVQVCPVGARFRTPEGFILVDNDHCLGCAYCVQACPYGATFINPVKKVSDKCTWCYHRVKKGKLPACVTVCPNKARLFGDLKDPESEVTKIFKEDKWMILKPAMDTVPYCFYVGLPREVI